MGQIVGKTTRNGLAVTFCSVVTHERMPRTEKVKMVCDYSALLTKLYFILLKTNSFFIGCALVVSVLCLYAIQCGIGLTFDSHHYLAAARSLRHSGTLLNADGTVYTNWPPLYPVLLALAQGNWLLIRIGQVLVFLGILFLTHQISQKYIQHFLVRAFLIGAVTVGTPLVLVTVFVWSEGVFILLTLAMYLFFRRYVTTNQVAAFIGWIVLSNLLCLQRLVGVVFVVAVGVLFWLIQKDTKRTIFYVLFSLVSVALWLWRNAQLETTPSFMENVWVTPLEQTWMGYVDAVSTWFVPVNVSFTVKTIVGVLWILGILFFWVWYRPTVCSLAFQATFLALFYLIGMIVLNGTVTEIDRFAAPGFVWVFLGIGAGLDTVFPSLPHRRRWLMLAIVGVWLLYPVSRTVKNVLFWHEANCQTK